MPTLQSPSVQHTDRGPRSRFPRTGPDSRSRQGWASSDASGRPSADFGVRLLVAGRPARAGPRHGGRPVFADDGDLDAARALVESAEHAELFLYPGDQHLFADTSLPSYDTDAAALLGRRVLDFLITR